MTKAIGALCVVVVCAGPVLAVPTVKVSGGPYQADPGGEFTALVVTEGLPGNPVGSQFQTFCVEKDEYISLGSTCYGTISSSAILGGVGGPEPDPLDPRTAWLYTQFLDGTLAGYDFANTGIGRPTSAAALQDAIWYIEQEITTLPAGLATDFYNAANAGGWTTLGNIRALNLWGDSSLTDCKQDLLIAVPAPGVLGLAFLGAALVGLLRRRKAIG